ncbi:SH3 domain-containing protein [Mesorhizobium captivum]|uniref:SH3 domain-containing protein n=1 Tax=Mesorhizobium captivum TaxID=3072319 RepID=UPI003D6B3591
MIDRSLPRSQVNSHEFRSTVRFRDSPPAGQTSAVCRARPFRSYSRIALGARNHDRAASGGQGSSSTSLVSLKASSANLRVGPGTGYDIEWVMTRPGIPLEIYQQYDNWRRVRDWEGTTGWIYGPLLSGRRTGIVAPWTKDNVALRKKATVDSPVIAWLEPRVRVKLTRCDGKWCAVASGSTSGFVKQTNLWGVYPGEVL